MSAKRMEQSDISCFVARPDSPLHEAIFDDELNYDTVKIFLTRPAVRR